MTKRLYLPLLMALVVALSSCSSKMGELSSDYFTVTPQVLEAVGGKVPATINGKFPEKYFNKKAVVEVTPVLKWNGGEAKGQSAVFQGEKVEGNDQTISYKMGGNYTMKTSFDYVPEMAKSELYLEFKATIGNKTVTIPAVKVADGVISTSEMVEQTLSSATPANGDDAFQRIIKEKHDANIMFLIQQANIRSSELKTAKAFNEEVKNINEAANKKISNIEVSAYASPDGGVSLNTTLAENREGNTTKMLSKDLKKAKIDAPIDAKYTAQDWEGFQELVSKSNIQDKELILRVLSMYSDPEQREQEIKNISSVYSTLAEEILPQLRRSRLTLNYDVIGKSDEEIASLADSDAKQLNIEELLYAATLTNDPAKQEAIFTKATQIYPNDYRAYNNLAAIAYSKGDLNAAKSYLTKANSVKSNNPESNVNLGMIALCNGNVEEAENYMAKGNGASNYNEALGNLQIAKGNYAQANSYFKGINSNSAALAQILSKDYNSANKTLSQVANPDATTSYLKAIVAARTNDKASALSNLKDAVAKDSSYAEYAAKDLEFAKFNNDAEFKNIVK